jgi:hypothetical protein
MNMKRLIFAIIAGWVVIFGTDFLIHGLWLKPDYDATKAIWRPENEMQAHFCWMLFAQFLCAATFVIIWAKGFAGGSVGCGAAFGLLMGLFQQVWAIVDYVVLPMPGELAVKWFCSGLVQAILLGIVTALVYKPSVAAAGTTA